MVGGYRTTMKPYLIISDLHFHNFSPFSTILEDGMNSRLQIQIDEVKRAVTILKMRGGDTIFNGGDTFHVRGTVATTVLNPVIDLFKWIEDQGMTIYSICGNHDLASKDSDSIGNATRSLASYSSFTSDKVMSNYGYEVIMFPWRSSLDVLMEELEEQADKNLTAIIHAPVDDVISGLPNHGLSPDYLENLGYKRVFAGHYHSHKNFNDKVYSIGSLYHQTWSDVDSLAGFIIVDDDTVIHHESCAPKFLDASSIDFNDKEKAAKFCKGNYVRVKITTAKDSEVAGVREELMEHGAVGISIIQNKVTASLRTKEAANAMYTVQDLIKGYVKKMDIENKEALEALCFDIVREAEAA